jgi:hypothetical protein
MPRQTIQQRLTTALLARGYVRATGTQVTRYLVFAPGPDARSLLKPNPEHDTTHRIYLGKNGSARYSTRGTVGTSIPFSPRTVERLLEEAK